MIDKATGQHCVTGERALDWNERGRRGGGALADHIAWDDVQDGSIHVRRQVLVRPRAVRDVRRVYVRDTLKNRRPRRVRLDDQTASELRRWKAEQNAERLVFDAAWKTDGGVRPSRPTGS